MPTARSIFPYLLGALVLGLLWWALSGDSSPPAEFRFVYGDEVKTIDPANVTGAPEGRIIRALFEGLLDWHPETLEPVPGVAYLPEISPDEKTYTFRLREDAVWVDAELNTRPVTAHDFVYSWRRFLDPLSAAEYASLLRYVVNAKKYNTGAIEPGDPVEVELRRPEPSGGPRGELLFGELVSTEQREIGKDADGNPKLTKIYSVGMGECKRRFSPAADKLNDEDIELCAQVVLDFREVGIKAIDDLTLQVQLNEPVAFFEKLLGFYPLFPVDRVCIETHGYPAWTKKENLVCNGPYLLEDRRFRDRIRFRKNPKHWDQKNIHVETMEALVVSSDTTQLNLYETGQVDWIITVPSTAIPTLLEQDRPDFKPPTQLAIYYYLVNCTKAPLGVPPEEREKLLAAGKYGELEEMEERARKVRQALALTLDNGEIVAKVARAGELRATGFVPPGIAPYDKVRNSSPDWIDESKFTEEERLQRNSQRREANVKRARELLAEAGYPDGKGLPKIEILYNVSESHEQIAELIQSQWQEALKIDSELIKKDFSSYLSDQRYKNYFVSRSGWIGDYVDPYTFLELCTTDHAQNRSGWSHPFYHWLTTGSLAESYIKQLVPYNEESPVELSADEVQQLLKFVAGTGEIAEPLKAKLSPRGNELLARLKADIESNLTKWEISDAERDEIDAEVRARENWEEKYHDDWVALRRSRLVRLKKMFVAEQMLQDHAPVIPIYFYVTKAMCRPYIKGWYHNLQDVHPYRGIRVDTEQKQKLFEELGLR